jgi:phage baseplate assembly protein W
MGNLGDVSRDHIAVGIRIPFGPGQSNFQLNYTTVDQARTNIINLLLTHKGERFMQPNFGTNLRRFIFRPNTSQLAESIRTELLTAIQFWLPYVTVENIDVQRTVQNIEDYVVNVTITFAVSSDIREFRTVSFGFDSGGGVSVKG